MKTALMMMAGMSILRAPNTGEPEASGEEQMFDPLGLGDINLNDTDTSMPVLVQGNYLLNVKSVALVENKAKTGNNLLVIFELQCLRLRSRVKPRGWRTTSTWIPTPSVHANAAH